MNAQSLQQMKALVEQRSTDAYDIFNSLVPVVSQLRSLPPFLEDTPQKESEVMFVKQLYEQVLLLDTEGDSESFVRHYTFLNSLYSSFPSLADPFYIGLNLLFYLSENHLSRFFIEQESLSHEMLQNPLVQFPIALQASIEDGRFVTVNELSNACPNAWYRNLLQKLMQTVRKEIADNLECSVKQIPQTDLAEMLQMDASQLAALAQERGWALEGGVVSFPPRSSGNRGIDAMPIVERMVLYAGELDEVI